MNPFCPYDHKLLKLTREKWKCSYCGESWKKGDRIMEKAEADPILFLRRLFG
jgi:PHP family Zn ribbon phosphoesterase